jgi:hypothetical protein
MATTTPIRIPVCNSDGVIIERIDFARARRLSTAPNATAVRARKGGTIVRILLGSVGDDSAVKKLQGDPKRYTYLDRSEEMPQGVHTLRRLPTSTRSLYRLSVTDCLRFLHDEKELQFGRAA